MKGIIFVVWEKYLGERFGSNFIKDYRSALGETESTLPITGRTYPDALLLQWLKTASSMTLLSEDHNHMILTYDSSRHLCSLLEGCIYGAAERFGERARVRESACLKRGDRECRFEVHFLGESWAKRATPEMIEREKQRLSKQGLSNLVLQALPSTLNEGLALREIMRVVHQNQGPYFPEIYKEQRQLNPVHISQIYSVIAKLQQVGLVASTVNRPGDMFENRRYWRAPTSDEHLA